MYIDENKSMVKRMFGEYSARDVDRDSNSKDNSISTFDGSPVYKKSRRPKRNYNSKFNDNSRYVCLSLFW